MYKHFNHEGGNCSPLLAYWPKGISKGDRWVRSPVHLIDFMPTILEVAQGEYPESYGGEEIHPLEGRSLVPFFKGAGEASERVLCFDHFESSAIRSGDWKLVRGNNRYKNRSWELYDLSRDRCETVNLISERPDLANRLEAEWLAWAKRMKISPYYEFVEMNPSRTLTKIQKNKKGYYLFRHGDQVTRDLAPDFSGNPFELIVTFERGKAKDGVLVSHGGSTSGYSLYLEDGRLVFACRNKGSLKVLKSNDPLPKERIVVSARLEKDGKVEVLLGEKVLSRGLFSLIGTFPQDPLEVGNDSLSSVSDYKGNTRFKGKINQVKLKIR
jgi:arylsulfatase